MKREFAGKMRVGEELIYSRARATTLHWEIPR